MPDLNEMEIFAWVGEDEFGTGEIGLKQGFTPAGLIPMVSKDAHKLAKYWEQAEEQAAVYGKRIFFCRFKVVEVMQKTSRGTP